MHTGQREKWRVGFRDIGRHHCTSWQATSDRFSHAENSYSYHYARHTGWQKSWQLPQEGAAIIALLVSKVAHSTFHAWKRTHACNEILVYKLCCAVDRAISLATPVKSFAIFQHVSAGSLGFVSGTGCEFLRRCLK